MYRWRYGQRTGPWRRCKRAVEEAAVNHGLGWWDEYPDHKGEHRLYAGPLLVIEQRP